MDYKTKIEKIRRDAEKEVRDLYRKGYNASTDITNMTGFSTKHVYRFLDLDNMPVEDKIEHQKNKLIREELEKQDAKD